MLIWTEAWSLEVIRRSGSGVERTSIRSGKEEFESVGTHLLPRICGERRDPQEHPVLFVNAKENE